MSHRISHSSGATLALMLISGFHSMTDEVILELEKQGFAGTRAIHAFALEAIDAGADTASSLGRRVSVSKQAAAKTIASLEELGFVRRKDDPNDARRKVLRVTARGYKMLQVGGQLFNAVRDRWAAQIGASQLEAMEAHLAELVKLRTLSAEDISRPPKKADSAPL